MNATLYTPYLIESHNPFQEYHDRIIKLSFTIHEKADHRKLPQTVSAFALIYKYKYRYKYMDLHSL